MRKHYIDNIRWMIQVLVVIYHLFYIYGAKHYPGTLGMITSTPFIPGEIYQYSVYPWFMVALFIVAGISSKLYLDNHTSKEFIKSRTTRLLVPSTIGLLVFGWVQGYISMQLSGADMDTSTVPAPILYLIRCLSGTGVLWFLQVLWVLSLILIPIRALEKGRLRKLGGKTNIIVLIALALPVWGAAQILNTPMIVVYRFGLYGIAFFLGYFIFSHDEIIDKLKRFWWLFTALGVASVVTFVVLHFGEEYPDAPVNRTWSFCFCSYFMSVAVLALGAKFLDFRNGFTAWMGKRSFGLYVFHYLGISAVALFIASKGILPAWLIYIISTVSGFGGALLINEIFSRIPFIRWAVLGIKKNRKKEAANVQG